MNIALESSRRDGYRLDRAARVSSSGCQVSGVRITTNFVLYVLTAFCGLVIVGWRFVLYLYGAYQGCLLMGRARAERYREYECGTYVIIK
jgi:hypothetical protein